jgi:hypothetical protein
MVQPQPVDEEFFDDVFDDCDLDYFGGPLDPLDECEDTITYEMCSPIPEKHIRDHYVSLDFDQSFIEEKERQSILEEEYLFRECGIGDDDIDASCNWNYRKKGLELHSRETLDPRRFLTCAPARLGPVWTGPQDTDPYQLRPIDITYLENHIKAGRCGNNSNCLFLKLPLEIRQMIYEWALPDPIRITHRRKETLISRNYNDDDEDYSHYSHGEFGLPFWMLASRQILLETLHALRSLSKFYIPVKISYPPRRRCRNVLMDSILKITRLKLPASKNLHSTATDPIILDHYEQRPYMLLVEVQFRDVDENCSNGIDRLCYAMSWDEWKGGEIIRGPGEYLDHRGYYANGYQWVRLTVRGPPNDQSRREMTEILDAGQAMANRILVQTSPPGAWVLTEPTDVVYLSQQDNVPVQFLFKDRGWHQTQITDRPECVEISTRVVRTYRSWWCSFRDLGPGDSHVCRKKLPELGERLEWEWSRVLFYKCASNDKTHCLTCNDDRCGPCRTNRMWSCGDKRCIDPRRGECFHQPNCWNCRYCDCFDLPEKCIAEAGHFCESCVPMRWCMEEKRYF